MIAKNNASWNQRHFPANRHTEKADCKTFKALEIDSFWYQCLTFHSWKQWILSIQVAKNKSSAEISATNSILFFDHEPSFLNIFKLPIKSRYHLNKALLPIFLYRLSGRQAETNKLLVWLPAFLLLFVYFAMDHLTKVLDKRKGNLFVLKDSSLTEMS